jgi:signal transduction histidine kinase
MNAPAIRVLLVEDNEADAVLFKHILAETGGVRFDVTHAELMADARDLLASRPFDVVLLDLSLPDSRGLQTVEQANAVAPGLPIVVLTGLDDEATGIEAVRKGAQDYLVKGQFDGRLLGRAVRYAMERKEAEQELKALNESLEERVAERTAVATRRAVQLRALAAELTLTELRERRRLAEILHDHLQQLLYAARLNLGSLRQRIPEGDLAETVEQIDVLLDQALTESRTLTVELSPPVLYASGLKGALEWLARHMEQTCGLTVEFEADPRAEPDSEDVRILLFQSVRELLFNVVKHAGVRRARVTMVKSPRDRLRLVVADEGSGFDVEEFKTGGAAAAGFGLFSIGERLELLGGSMELDSAPGRGTRVTVYAPCHRSGRTEADPAAFVSPDAV